MASRTPRLPTRKPKRHEALPDSCQAPPAPFPGPSVLILRRTIPPGWENTDTTYAMPLRTAEEYAATLLHVLRSWVDDGNMYPPLGDPPPAPELTDKQISALPVGRVRLLAERDRDEKNRAFDAYTAKGLTRAEIHLALDRADLPAIWRLLCENKEQAGIDSIEIVPLNDIYTWWKLT